MPSAGTELLAALDDDGALELLDELSAMLLDDLLPPPLPPPQATRPRMLSVSALSVSGR